MKKKILILFLIIALAAAPLFGCANTFGTIRLKPQDTDYVVTSNGGNAVRYGNYIYFVNGNRGFEDTDAKNNVWGNVKKGALYRVALKGSKSGNDFITATDPDTGLEFDSKAYILDGNERIKYLTETELAAIRVEGSLFLETEIERPKDYEGEAEFIEKTYHIEDVLYEIQGLELVAPKVIGTSGYSEGGIFIFDNYVYYATPNNQRDKKGVVQYEKTDFMRTSLDGKRTQKIYTTASKTASSPYKFYKMGKSVYLVVLDGAKIMSVRMNDRKVVETLTLTEHAKTAYFPNKAVYNRHTHGTQLLNGVEDYIYYTRDIVKEDLPVRQGTAIEAMRADGTERFEVVKNGTESTVESVRDGFLFYRTKNSSGGTMILYTNLHDALIANGTAKTEADRSAYQELMAGTALSDVSSDYTSTYCFRADPAGDNILVLCFSSSAMFLHDDIAPVKILDGNVNMVGIYGNRIYYNNDSNAYYYANLFTPSERNTPHLIAETATVAGARADLVDGYFMFFGKVDQYAAGYALFYPLNETEGATPFFIGQIIKADQKPLPDDAKVEEPEQPEQ